MCVQPACDFALTVRRARVPATLSARLIDGARTSVGRGEGKSTTRGPPPRSHSPPLSLPAAFTGVHLAEEAAALPRVLDTDSFAPQLHCGVSARAPVRSVNL
eukprot:4308563-Prymnesium_polylepis.1